MTVEAGSGISVIVEATVVGIVTVMTSPAPGIVRVVSKVIVVESPAIVVGIVTVMTSPASAGSVTVVRAGQVGAVAEIVIVTVDGSAVGWAFRELEGTTTVLRVLPGACPPLQVPKSF